MMRTQSFQAKSAVDKLLVAFRLNKVYRVLNKIKIAPEKLKIIDMGSGKGFLIQQLRKQGYDALGIDLVQNNHVIKADLNKSLPIDTNTVDIITSLANIEHLEQPQVNLNEIYRILKADGQLVLTTPALKAKPILEFIAYKLKWIDAAEILDHKFYYTKETLKSALNQAGFKKIRLTTFQLGLNLYAIAKK